MCFREPTEQGRVEERIFPDGLGQTYKIWQGSYRLQLLVGSFYKCPIVVYQENNIFDIDSLQE